MWNNKTEVSWKYKKRIFKWKRFLYNVIFSQILMLYEFLKLSYVSLQRKPHIFTKLKKRYGMLHTKRFVLWFSLSISYINFSTHNVKVSGYHFMFPRKKPFHFYPHYFIIQLLTSYTKLFVNLHRLSRSRLATYFGISVVVKILGQRLDKMVFFAFHHYLVTSFHLNNFFFCEL